MDHCEIYLGVFGLWGWESMSADGAVICESRQVFDCLEECLEDARLHGYGVNSELSRPALLLAA